MIDFPRLRELSRISPAFSGVLEEMSNPVKRKVFKNIEADLGKLDNDAWKVLRQKVTPHLKSDYKRAWQQMYDRLNEAKGYNHLVSLGCTDIQFISEGSKRAPDLKGTIGRVTVLCEVKTINTSDVEMKMRRDSRAREFHRDLPEAFFRKLICVLKDAEEQLECHMKETGTRENVRGIVFFVVNFDDQLSENLEEHKLEIGRWINDNSKENISIEVFAFPSYYWVTHK